MNVMFLSVEDIFVQFSEVELIFYWFNLFLCDVIKDSIDVCVDYFRLYGVYVFVIGY